MVRKDCEGSIPSSPTIYSKEGILKEEKDSASPQASRDESEVFNEEDFEKLFRLKGEGEEQLFSKPQEKWWQEPPKPLIIKRKKVKKPPSHFWSDLERPSFQFKLTSLTTAISVSPLKWVVLVLFLIIIIFWPTLFSRLDYWYRTDFKNLPFKTFSETELKRQVEINAALGRGTIYIPKIGVLAPLIFDLPQSYTKEIRKLGLIHLKDTVKPPNPGQAIILGGSLRYIFVPRGFSDCLALLDQLIVGDELYFFKENKRLKYKVSQVSLQLSTKPISFYNEFDRTIENLQEPNRSEIVLTSQFPFAPWRRIYVSFKIAE